MSDDESFAGDTSAFVTGDDFIGFDLPSAGPSRSPSPDLPSLIPPRDTTGSTAKGKGRADAVVSASASAAASAAPSPAADSSSDSPKNREERRADLKRKGKGIQPPPKRTKVEVAGDRVGPRNLKEERRAAERAAPWADDVDWDQCTNPAEMLNEEIHAFYRLMSPTRAEYDVRKAMIELIAHTIWREWRDAEVVPFGSWQTQLYLPMGDIDLVVSTPQLNERNKTRLLQELARMMRVNQITKTVAVITKAKVPIIKFVTNDGNINVDISLNQENGVSAAKIMMHYLDAIPGARELILVLKSYLSQRSMNEVYTGGLGSYSAICMVLSFLQTHPKIRRSEIDARRNLGVLLVEFFELYGRNYNYDDVTINVRRGGGYCTKRSKGWQFWNGQAFLLSIQDPQDADNDISRSSFGIRQVKLNLAGAYELLTARLFEVAKDIDFREREKKLRARNAPSPEPMDPQQMTILGKIMGVTKETNKFRRELETLDSAQVVQRKLDAAIARFGALPGDALVHPSHRGSAGDALMDGVFGSGVRTSTPPPPPMDDDDDDAGVGAIIVDDGSDLGDNSSDMSLDETDDDGSDYKPLAKRSRDRYASVSSDSIDEVMGPLADADDESRYAITNGKGAKGKAANGPPKSNGNKTNGTTRAASVPPPKPSRAPTPTATVTRGGVRSKPASRMPSPPTSSGEMAEASPRLAPMGLSALEARVMAKADRERRRRKSAERKAFWASKGVVDVSDDEEDEV